MSRPEPEPSDPFVAVVKGVAASLLIYWFGVLGVQQIFGNELMPYARYLGWLACTVAALVTARSIGEPWDRATMFGLATLIVAVPMTYLGESVRMLNIITFAGRAEATLGINDVVAKNRYMALHLLPTVFGLITIVAVAGTLMFRQRLDRD